MATATQTMSARQQAEQRPKINFVELAKASYKEFSQDDCLGMAAESAYHILFAIFPLAIFAAAMSGIINRVYNLDLFNRIMNALTSRLPADAAKAIAEPLKQVLTNQSGGLLSIGILLALWSGSGAMSTFIKAMNRAYDVEETRPIWKAKGLQVLLTLFMGVVASVAFIVIVFGGKIGDFIAGKLHAGPVFTIVWNILRWPIIVAFIMFGLAVLYWVGPNVKQGFKWLSPGAIVATIVWLVMIGAFGIYVSKFSSYNKTYGTLGGMIVLMLVFYYSSLIVMLGAEMNSELGKRYDPETISDLAAHPEKDKGETIYADKAPKKKPEERETDLKGAQVRGENPDGPPAAATAKVDTGKGSKDRPKMVNYATGKHEQPVKEDPQAAFRMTPPSRSRLTASGTTFGDSSRGSLLGVGLMALGAIGLSAKKLMGK